MQRPIVTLLLAIGLILLGSLLLAPVSDYKPVFRPDGQVARRADGRLVMVPDPHHELRVNWPAYLCLAAGAAALAWTLFLVVYGLVAVVRARGGPNKTLQPTAASSSASGISGNLGARPPAAPPSGGCG
jgi:hypothetical protein